VAAALGLIAGVALANEDSEGIDLPLMVTDCVSQPLDDMLVEVQIYRPGSGVIDSDSGYTDNGSITFRFAGLECDDEARVTLTPSTSEAPDSDHEYTYVGDCGLDDPHQWSIAQGGQLCPDGWWTPTRIQSVYYTGN
jgi:hypothetical protein